MALRLLLLLAALLLGAWGPHSATAAARRGSTELLKAPGNCSEPPPQVENAEVPKGSSDSNRLRYSCVKNYKRKAGTSSLAVCRENATTKKFEWDVRLTCIKDPSLPATTTEDPRRGSLPLRIGVPCLVLVALLLVGCLAFRWHRRPRSVQGQADVPLEEQIPMAAERSEPGDQAPLAAGSPDDLRPTDEGLRTLPPHCSPSSG
nr:uncharacterized protein LOC118091031 isoform X2 [Zootoca vivipara]